MKIFWATLSLFCVTSTLVANAEQTAEGYLDQYLEENKENLSQKEIDLFSKYREEIISILGISLNNSPEIRIEDFLANALEDASNAMTATMNGDWMWFGAFPWVYSSKYESWLYLYPNLDVSIYGENGYTRKDSNYSTKMKWVWVVREDDSFLSYWNDPQQSRFAYSNDEKAWLHFKQSKGDELLSFSVDTERWGVFGKEIFEWIHLYAYQLPEQRNLTIKNIEMKGGSILSLSNPIYSMEMELHASTRPRRDDGFSLEGEAEQQEQLNDADAGRSAKSEGAENNGSATLGDLADQGLISPTDKNALVAVDAINAAGGLFAEKTSGEAGITNPSSGN